MADGEVKIKIGADSADMINTLRKLGILEADVTKGAAEGGKAMEQAWKSVVTEGVLASRQLERMQGQLDRLRERAGKGGIFGGGWASFVTGLNQARELIGSIASAAVQLGRALWENAVKPAMEFEDSLRRVAALNGGGADGAAAAGRVDAVANAWQDYSTQGNNEFSARVEQAQRAGLSLEQAMRAVQSAFVAAQGHQETADAILQQILQAEAAGQTTERAIKFFERQGLDIRAGLAEQFNVTREEVAGLLKDGEVGVEDLLGALQRLTGEGSRAWESFQESLASTSAEVRRAENDWGDALKAMGTQLLPGVAEAMREVSRLVRELGPEFSSVGKVLTDVLLVALEKAVRFVDSVLDGVRYMYDFVTEGGDAAAAKWEARQEARDDARWEQDAAERRRAREAEFQGGAQGRVEDPETAAARAARQEAARAEKAAAAAREQAARNEIKLWEAADQRRYSWVMKSGRVMDVDSELTRTRGLLDAVKGKLAADEAAGKTELTDERMAALQRMTALGERMTALEGRREKLVSGHLAEMMKRQLDAQAATAVKEVVGMKSSTVNSSLAAIGGGGGSFRGLESVQLQETKKQTATLGQLQQVATSILRVMPRQLGAVLS